MVGEITNEAKSPLLPDRFEQADLFVCDIFDAAPKGDMASMAHPIFSLSTKPDHRIRRSEDETGKNFVEVKPSAEGLATIHDRDVLIYCISQLIAAIKELQEKGYAVPDYPEVPKTEEEKAIRARYWDGQQRAVH